MQEYTASGRGRLLTLAELPGTSSFTSAAQNDRGDTWVVYGRGDPSAGGETNSLWKVSRSGEATKVLDIAAYQESDPDPYDIEDNPAETNGYDVEVMRDGSVVIADAAGNDLLRVTEDGDVTTVACFPTEVVSTEDAAPYYPGLPPEMPAESVPTGVSVGRDGYAYVGELKGFPF